MIKLLGRAIKIMNTCLSLISSSQIEKHLKFDEEINNRSILFKQRYYSRAQQPFSLRY